MLFTLKKISIDPGKTSRVFEGYSTTGRELHAFNAEGSHILNDISEVKTGYQLLLIRNLAVYLRTSTVEEVTFFSKDKILVKTQTSVYELTQKEEED